MGIVIASGIKFHRRGGRNVFYSSFGARTREYTAKLELNYGTTMARTTSCASDALARPPTG